MITGLQARSLGWMAVLVTCLALMVVLSFKVHAVKSEVLLAERQILLQRQGNDIFVKNLSPVLEMRVDGWVCEEAVLQPGAHISIEQHRFRFEAPTGETATQIEPEMAEPFQPVNAKDTTPADPARPIFSPAQWILLAVAVAISGFFIILLSFSP